MTVIVFWDSGCFHAHPWSLWSWTNPVTPFTSLSPNAPHHCDLLSTQKAQLNTDGHPIWEISFLDISTPLATPPGLVLSFCSHLTPCFSTPPTAWLSLQTLWLLAVNPSFSLLVRIQSFPSPRLWQECCSGGGHVLSAEAWRSRHALRWCYWCELWFCRSLPLQAQAKIPLSLAALGWGRHQPTAMVSLREWCFRQHFL